jgi:lysophospholipase L1-like esterase
MTKALLSVFFLLIITSCQPRMLKVICIGDSITQGKVFNDSITQLSYRFYLWEKLDSAGYRVDMLGSNSIWFQENRKRIVQTPVSTYTGRTFDRDHEAFYGIKTGEFLNGGFTHDSVEYLSLKDRLSGYDAPDFAFVHIGTNDSKNDSLQTINSLKQILEVLHDRNPRMTIFLAKLNTPWVRFVNHSIEPVADEFKTKYPKMKLVGVDMASGWVNCPEAPGAMTLDWAHPNTLGQKVMAEKWVKAYLSLGDHQKPDFVASTKVTGLTDSTATISWTPATDNKYIAGYNVMVNNQMVNWRRSECGGKEKQCIALVQGNSFTITNLKRGEEYELSVSAVDFVNNVTFSDKINLIPNSTK